MFRKYDIRGVYPDDVNEINFYRMGLLLKQFMRDRNITEFNLAQDYREHSESLANALALNTNAVRVGVMPTPTICSNKGFNGIITASHNPSNYNGLKLFLDGESLSTFGPHLKKYVDRFDDFVFDNSVDVKNETPIDNNLHDEIINSYLANLPKSGNAFFDLGGGAACAVKHVFPNRIYDEPDPYFKCRDSEPTDQSLTELKKLSVSNNTLGFAFDGDADRVVAVDKQVIDSDVLGGFIVEHFEDVFDTRNVVMTIDSSFKVYRKLKEQGYNCQYSPVGEVFVTELMRQHKNSFGFESSGHYFSSLHDYNSDGPYYGLMLSNTPQGRIFDYQKGLNIQRVKFKLPGKIDAGCVKEVLENLGATEFVSMDGVKANNDDWSVLVRNSNTQNFARVNIESDDTKLIKELKEKIENKLNEN